MLEEIKKNKMLILITLIGWVAIIIGASFNYGIDTQEYKSLRFDNVTQKRDVIKFSESEFVPRTEMESNFKSVDDKLDLILEIVKAKK